MHLIEIDHETQTGHRIPGHEGGRGKCARLHGHTYGFRVQVSADVLSADGFVADFGDVRRILDEWDHRTLLWANDPFQVDTQAATVDLRTITTEALSAMIENDLGIIRVPFIPTAENMAQHLAQRIVSEFEDVVFACIEVHETERTTARYYCTPQDVALERAAHKEAR